MALLIPATEPADAVGLPQASAPETLQQRLGPYVARVGLKASATNLGIATHTLERALGGLRVHPAITRQMLDVLDRDDRARANTTERTSEGQ